MDPNLEKLQKSIAFEYEQTFMVYLLRMRNHCLNPACVAACPSGAMYKREEDGIVLVDQNKCKGWRFCVTACPIRKSTLIGKPIRPRNVPSVTPESRRGCLRSVQKLV
jgi:nitrate reductase beta subunit